MLVLTAITSALLAATPTSKFNTPATPDLAALAVADYHFDPNVASPESSALALTQTTAPDSAPPTAPTLRKPFGTTDSKYWFISAGGGSDFQDEDLARFGGGYSYFVADGFSFDFELNGLYFGQPENDAVGINFNFLLRWHFWQNEARTVSIYADAGAGLSYCTEDVPDDGSRFGFTPQAGMGMSFDVGNDLRMFTGVRWHHVSNARLFESNPGTDVALFYVMLSWPF